MIEIPGNGLGPKIDRPITLNCMGDWGQANFHKILSWLCQEINDRAGPGSIVNIRNGKGGKDAFDAVSSRQVDLAISTPTSFSRMALVGKGVFDGVPQPHLRALAVLPQNDRLLFAIDKKFGIDRVEQIAERGLPLRIAVGTQDGINLIGVGARGMLEASGLSRTQLRESGGDYLEFERPDACLASMQNGEADAVVQEAIMTPWWLDMLKSRDVSILSWSPEALQTVEINYLWERAKLEAGYFPGQMLELDALQFSDFQLIVHRDMPREIAHLITWCLCNTSRVIERQFESWPQTRTPLGYPLEAVKMAKTILPLHEGAKAYYVQHGLTF